MTEDHVEIVCIVDRSGSMHRVESDALGGYNSFLEAQKQLPHPARLTLVLFNHEHEVVHDAADLADVPELDRRAYAIGGTTALLDAVGTAIETVRNRLAALPEERRPGGVLVAVLTDGLENASREYTRERVFELITEQQAAGWEFMFLAANQDAIREGGSMGIAAADAQGFAHTAEGVRRAYSGMSERAMGTRRRVAGRGGSKSASPGGEAPIGFRQPDDGSAG